MRQALFQRGTNASEKASAVNGHIPFVDRDDEGAALLNDMVRDLQILHLKTFGRIQQQHHHFGKVDGMARVGHGQLFELVLYLGTLAHPCGVDQAHTAFGQHRWDVALFVGLAFLGTWVCPDPIDRNTVAGNPCLGPRYQPVFAQNLVNQRRFSGVRAAHNRQLQYRIWRFGVRHFKRATVNMRQQGLKQIGHTLAMFTADRDGVSKAKRIAFQYAVIALLALGLVDREYHGRRTAAQPAGNFFVKRGYTNAAIDQEQRHLRACNRRFGLHPHSTRQGLGIFILIACGVDDGEFQVEQTSFAFTAVTGDARRVIDKREFLANQPVEQSGLADIGPTDNGYRRQHAGTSPLRLIHETRKCAQNHPEYIRYCWPQLVPATHHCQRQEPALLCLRRALRTKPHHANW